MHLIYKVHINWVNITGQIPQLRQNRRRDFTNFSKRILRPTVMEIHESYGKSEKLTKTKQ